jgi:hypothetical protein
MLHVCYTTQSRKPPSNAPDTKDFTRLRRTHMTVEKIRDRLAQLRSEIQTLRHSELLYKSKRLHVVGQDLQHEERVQRMQDILLELESLRRPVNHAA